jgi:Chitin binding Peritrophin-A domain
MRDPNNCGVFYRCDHGKILAIETCADGLHFNEVNKTHSVLKHKFYQHYFRKREIAIGRLMWDVNPLVALQVEEVTGRNLQ